MARGVTLTRSEPVFVQHAARNDGWRIVISATEAELMPVEIFLNQQGVLNARTQVRSAEFVAIASPVSLTTVPVDEPGELDYPPFYRTASIDVIVPSREMAEQLWLSVVAETNNLIETLDRMDRIEQVETIRCGDEPESSS